MHFCQLWSVCVHSPIWDGVSEFPWQPILTCPFLLHHFPNFKVRDSKWTSGSNLVQFRLVGTWYQVPGITLAWSSSFGWNHLTPPSSSEATSSDPDSIAISTYTWVSCQFSFFHHQVVANNQSQSNDHHRHLDRSWLSGWLRWASWSSWSSSSSSSGSVLAERMAEMGGRKVWSLRYGSNYPKVNPTIFLCHHLWQQHYDDYDCDCHPSQIIRKISVRKFTLTKPLNQTSIEQIQANMWNKV